MVHTNSKPKNIARGMTACGCIGLILVWYHTRGSCVRSFFMLFGQTSTPLYKWLNIGSKVLLHILSTDPDSKVSMPTNANVSFYHEVIGAKYPTYDNTWVAADGIKLLI